MESMLKSESYSSVPLALTSGFTSEADKLKAGQTKEGIQKLNSRVGSANLFYSRNMTVRSCD